MSRRLKNTLTVVFIELNQNVSHQYELGLKLVFFNGDFKSISRVSNHFSQNEKKD